MSDTVNPDIAHLLKLEIPLSRPFFRFIGRTMIVLASFLIFVGATVCLAIILTGGRDAIVLSLIWPLILFPNAALLMVPGYGRLRWSKNGPDLWLRISSEGIEFVRAGFRLRHYRFTWPQIQKWWWAEFVGQRRIFWIKASTGDQLVINPMDYVWTARKSRADIASAIALGGDIVALLKKYSRNRQGETESTSIG